MNAKNWPIVKVTLPADLKGVKPGELSPHLLRDVQPYGKLHWRAADAYHAMRDKAFADGIKPFKPTSAGDTYRTIAMQTTASPASMSHDLLAVEPRLNSCGNIVTGGVAKMPWFFWYDFP